MAGMRVSVAGTALHMATLGVAWRLINTSGGSDIDLDRSNLGLVRYIHNRGRIQSQRGRHD